VILVDAFDTMNADGGAVAGSKSSITAQLKTGTEFDVYVSPKDVYTAETTAHIKAEVGVLPSTPRAPLMQPQKAATSSTDEALAVTRSRLSLSSSIITDAAQSAPAETSSRLSTLDATLDTDSTAAQASMGPRLCSSSPWRGHSPIRIGVVSDLDSIEESPARAVPCARRLPTYSYTKPTTSDDDCEEQRQQRKRKPRARMTADEKRAHNALRALHAKKAGKPCRSGGRGAAFFSDPARCPEYVRLVLDEIAAQADLVLLEAFLGVFTRHIATVHRWQSGEPMQASTDANLIPLRTAFDDAIANKYQQGNVREHMKFLYKTAQARILVLRAMSPDGNTGHSSSSVTLAVPRARLRPESDEEHRRPRTRRKKKKCAKKGRSTHWRVVARQPSIFPHKEEFDVDYDLGGHPFYGTHAVTCSHRDANLEQITATATNIDDALPQDESDGRTSGREDCSVIPIGAKDSDESGMPDWKEKQDVILTADVWKQLMSWPGISPTRPVPEMEEDKEHGQPIDQAGAARLCNGARPSPTPTEKEQDTYIDDDLNLPWYYTVIPPSFATEDFAVLDHIQKDYDHIRQERNNSTDNTDIWLSPTLRVPSAFAGSDWLLAFDQLLEGLKATSEARPPRHGKSFSLIHKPKRLLLILKMLIMHYNLHSSTDAVIVRGEMSDYGDSADALELRCRRASRTQHPD